MPPAVSSRAWPPTVPIVRELTVAVSKVMFWTFRPASIVSGELGAFWLKRAVFVFVVVPAVAPGTPPDQLVLSAQLVPLVPVHAATPSVAKNPT